MGAKPGENTTIIFFICDFLLTMFLFAPVYIRDPKRKKTRFEILSDHRSSIVSQPPGVRSRRKFLHTKNLCELSVLGGDKYGLSLISLLRLIQLN